MFASASTIEAIPPRSKPRLPAPPLGELPERRAGAVSTAAIGDQLGAGRYLVHHLVPLTTSSTATSSTATRESLTRAVLLGDSASANRPKPNRRAILGRSRSRRDFWAGPRRPAWYGGSPTLGLARPGQGRSGHGRSRLGKARQGKTARQGKARTEAALSDGCRFHFSARADPASPCGTRHLPPRPPSWSGSSSPAALRGPGPRSPAPPPRAPRRARRHPPRPRAARRTRRGRVVLLGDVADVQRGERGEGDPVRFELLGALRSHRCSVSRSLAWATPRASPEPRAPGRPPRAPPPPRSPPTRCSASRAPRGFRRPIHRERHRCHPGRHPEPLHRQPSPAGSEICERVGGVDQLAGIFLGE